MYRCTYVLSGDPSSGHLTLLSAVPTHIQPHTSTTYCIQFCARNAGIQVSIRPAAIQNQPKLDIFTLSVKYNAGIAYKLSQVSVIHNTYTKLSPRS